jgi:hypothetical protein
MNPAQPPSPAASRNVPTGDRWRQVPWIARVLYYLIPFRRGIVLANLRHVFGQTLTEAEIKLRTFPAVLR